jgi:glucose/arabinose dehydrogenase
MNADFVVRGPVAAAIAGALLLGASPSPAQTFPDLPRPAEGPPTEIAERYLPEPPGVAVSPYATDLEVVWSLEFAPDGRLFIAERPGRVRVVSPDGRLDPTPWATMPGVEVRLEDGLLGLTLDPDFAREPWVYVFYTTRKGEELVNRVSRFRDVDGRGTAEQVLIDDLPSGRIHNGGRLRFGWDGMLYITLGEVGDPPRSQDVTDPAGSVLRITRDGRIPPDNPAPGNPLWAYGFRNPHGLAVRPSDGALFLGDNGPSSEWMEPTRIIGLDEVNIVRKGHNYGWPIAVGHADKEGVTDPILTWIPAVPPGDLIFYDGDAMPQLQGDLFYSSLAAQALLRIRFDDPSDPDRPTAVERWFHTGEPGGSVHGRLRGMAVGPDGALYVGTGNRDNRARLRDGDDQVLRIAPR